MPIRVHIDKDQPFVRRRLRESAAEMLHHFRRRIGVFGAVTIRPSQQADNAARRQTYRWSGCGADSALPKSKRSQEREFCPGGYGVPEGD